MTDTTEAEARARNRVMSAFRNTQVYGDVDGGAMLATLDAYAEAVRATEREKVRALVELLVAKARCGCGLASIDYGESVPHTKDCPWVEARLWLDGGAE